MEKYKIFNEDLRAFEDTLNDEFLDCREGVLWDSYITYTKDGHLIAAFETFETCWSSCLTVYESNGTKKDDLKVWAIWEEYAENYDKEYAMED